MVSNSQDVWRPNSVLTRNSSVRSCSSLSSRGSSSWDPDASVRLFVERSRESILLDETYDATSSEDGSRSGSTSPELQDYLSTPISETPMTSICMIPIERCFSQNTFRSDMSTSDLVVAAREAAEALSIAIQAPEPHTDDPSPNRFVGFGTVSKKEITFRRPVRASANRHAASNRRFVDILV